MYPLKISKVMFKYKKEVATGKKLFTYLILDFRQWEILLKGHSPEYIKR